MEQCNKASKSTILVHTLYVLYIISHIYVNVLLYTYMWMCYSTHICECVTVHIYANVLLYTYMWMCYSTHICECVTLHIYANVLLYTYMWMCYSTHICECVTLHIYVNVLLYTYMLFCLQERTRVLSWSTPNSWWCMEHWLVTMVTSPPCVSTLTNLIYSSVSVETILL